MVRGLSLKSLKFSPLKELLREKECQLYSDSIIWMNLYSLDLNWNCWNKNYQILRKDHFKESFLVKHERKLELGNHIVNIFLKDRIARILLTLLGGEILLFKHLKAPSCGVIIFTRLLLLLLTSQQITQAQFTCNKIFFTIRALD